MKNGMVAIHEDDYLAIRSGRLQPRPYAYVPDDLEKELADVTMEKKLIGRTVSELERGETEAAAEGRF